MELSDSQAVVRVKLRRRTRNHFNSMYFGGLAVGAELSVALAAVNETIESRKSVNFLFKDFHAEFLKRADGDTYFVCPDAGKVRELVAESFRSGERMEEKFHGFAYVDVDTQDPVMKYSLTISIKNRK